MFRGLLTSRGSYGFRYLDASVLALDCQYRDHRISRYGSIELLSSHARAAGSALSSK
jgi:hypothetical protein